MVEPVVLGKVAAGYTYTPVQLSSSYNNASNYYSASSGSVASKVSSIINSAQSSYNNAAASVSYAAPQAVTYTQKAVYEVQEPVAVVPTTSAYGYIESLYDWGKEQVSSLTSVLNPEYNAAVTATQGSTTQVQEPAQTTMSAAQQNTTYTQGGYQQVVEEKAVTAAGYTTDSWGSIDKDVQELIAGVVTPLKLTTLPQVTAQNMKELEQYYMDLLAGYDYNTTGNYTYPQQYANASYASVEDSMCDLFGECGGTSNGILGAVSGALNAVINISTEAIAAVLAPIAGYINALSQNVKELARSAADSALKMATLALTLPMLIGNEVAKQVQNIKDMVRPYWEGIQSMFDNLTGKIAEVMQWAYQQMPSQIKSIVDSINKGFETMAGAWEWFKSNVFDKALEYFQNPGKLINDVWGYLTGKFTDLMTWVSTQLDNAKTWMWNKATEMYNYLMENWKEILLGLIPPEIQLGMKALYDLLTTYAPQIAEFLRKAAMNPEQTAQDLWDTAQKYMEIAQEEGARMIQEFCTEPLGPGS